MIKKIPSFATNILLTLATLSLIELILQISVDCDTLETRGGRERTGFLEEATCWHPRNKNLAWKMRFSKLYSDRDEDAIPISQGEYKTHPLLGWTPKANLSFTNSRNERYTTNSKGYRSLHEFSHQPTKYNILIVGDSMTYGSQADDSAVWPTLLQKKDARLNVLNLAVGGYGTDQMALTLELNIDEYDPDLVIVAFLSDNLRRSTLHFRDYWKPYYLIENDELTLRGTPVPDLPQGLSRVRSELKKYRLLNISRIIGMTATVYSGFTALGSPPRSDTQQHDWQLRLNELIFEKMVRTAQRRRADMLLLPLPRGKELTSDKYQSSALSFAERFASSRDVLILNPHGRFLKRKRRYSMGHYKMAGATVVAEAVHEFVVSLPGYRSRIAGDNQHLAKSRED